ncbi:MAG: DNA mismatch repair protein MutS [Gemmatimonadetes bacterium]|nr:DNA mismatch repair protein MutS [Gemmatimonadota bacterium]
MTAPLERYRAELARVRASLTLLDRRVGFVVAARLAVFLAVLGLAGLVIAQRGGPGLVGVGAGVVAFGGLVVWHERLIRRRAAAERSIGYLDRGVARLEDRWMNGGDDGARFADANHLYAADLELFGPGSLFHLLSTTRTETGATRLAAWLATPAPPAEIGSRQEAVSELAGRFELRHDLGVVAPAAGKALDSAALRHWLGAEPEPIADWVAPAALGIGMVNAATIAGALAGLLPSAVAVGALAVAGAIGLRLRPTVVRILAAVDRPARELRVIATLLERVAAESFSAERLAGLQRELVAADRSPLAAIASLERLVNLADARRNQLFLPVASVLMLGTQVGARVEAWRRRHGSDAARWLDAVGDLEALASLAGHAFDHPGDVFPTLAEPGSPIVATGLAHVLLPTDRAVRNDLAVGDPVRLVMVSGSNMSGKSTLLKAIGTNLVLAFAGAPVRALALSTPPLAIGASLVLRDSLLEGRSRFYAEVLRLREIAGLAGRGQPVLFLLDELLSGTNSHDRAIGAKGLLLGLVDRGAIGLVTTHDLALTAIAEELGPRGLNVHLEDRLIEGRLRFDYRLKPGVVTRSNALELMRAVGLPVEDGV